MNSCQWWNLRSGLVLSLGLGIRIPVVIARSSFYYLHVLPSEINSENDFNSKFSFWISNLTLATDLPLWHFCVIMRFRDKCCELWKNSNTQVYFEDISTCKNIGMCPIPPSVVGRGTNSNLLRRVVVRYPHRHWMKVLVSEWRTLNASWSFNCTHQHWLTMKSPYEWKNS